MNRAISHADRLYDLLPVVHRMRDADLGYPLRGLLQVISEQVCVVESDIAQLYENWFIETCQDWVVPYIGDLVGYTPGSSTGEPVDVKNGRALARERLVIPRSEVANTVRFRRRKGTIAVLEEMAEAVANWPARAVEFYRLLSYTQNINYLHLGRGRTIDVREGCRLEELGSPFEKTGHTLDIRAANSEHFPERYNVQEVGLFVWRLKTYPLTGARAYCLKDESPHCFSFSSLGVDMPLYNRSRSQRVHPPGKLMLPAPITRRDLERHSSGGPGQPKRSGVLDYYGRDKSFEIRVGPDRQLVPADSIIPADLSGWTYRPLPNQVAVDPELGRIVLPQGQPRRQSVWVSYSYAFSADIGGGGYNRTLSDPAGGAFYLIGEGEAFPSIGDALKQWQTDVPVHAVLEIVDNAIYEESVNISLKSGQTLQLRAANRQRPVIKLAQDGLSVTGEINPATGKSDCWFMLDGILVTGGGVQVQGDVAGVTIRHSTLVPGWGLSCDCEPQRPTEPSLELDNAPDCIRIEYSILGSIQVDRDEVKEDPCLIYLSDSILDATDPNRVALGAPEKLCAYAVLDARRVTVFGQVQTHAIQLVENSIFMGKVLACRRQQGCLRFCYVPPASRTPRRFECQPDLVASAVLALAKKDGLSDAVKNSLLASERLRVEPEFNSVRYGTPTYCQLANSCAVEITGGTDDESEMGVFHDLYQPQRAANLRLRLDEFTPAGLAAGIIFAS